MAKGRSEQTVIEFRNVYKSFDAPVLCGISLSVKQGEIVAVVGPSGTGKSVLLKTTIGLIVPDSGDVLVEGESVYFGRKDALKVVRKIVGYVFQNAALFDSMTVFENVALGLPLGEAKRIGRQAVLQRVVKALEDVNLDAPVVLRKLPAQLSGGMRKRVGLARAIVGEPDILLYDEPVTGLDPVNTAAIDQLITDTAARTGVTSLVVTHDVDGALAFCDRIALLEDGVLQFVGTPAQFRVCEAPLVRAFADRRAAAELARQGLGPATP